MHGVWVIDGILYGNYTCGTKKVVWEMGSVRAIWVSRYRGLTL